MTLNTLWSRLRKNNKKAYRQFQFCILFAMMLISSYLMLMFSPLIQKALPQGGDTGKQANMIFGIALLGCTIFVWYAARLFLRFKSREMGIFMALGAQKRNITSTLTGELFKMISIYALEGIAMGAAVAFLSGKIIEMVTEKVNDYSFAYSIQGLLASGAYALFLILMVFLLARNAMKRTNIIDVINEQRKQEPLKKTVTKGYFIWGMFFIVFGIFMGYFLKYITFRLMGRMLGSWVNAFYLLTALGIYQVLVYSVSSRQRGRNPQKYYDNLLNYGMMKFQGASVVRNMLVIVLLVLGGLYSVYYIPQMAMTGISQELFLEDGYSYRYLQDAREITKEEAEELAGRYQVEIQDYREGEFIRVKGSGVERDVDENSQLTEKYYDDYAEYDCTSAAEYEKMTGIRLEIPQGAYYLIQGDQATENTWYRFDDMDQLYSESKKEYLPLKYAGNTVYNALMITPSNGLDNGSRFVVSDEDYEVLRAGLPAEKMETQVLFSTRESEGEIPFAKALYKEFALRISNDMNVMEYYNAQEELRRGTDYAEMAEDAVFTPEMPAKATDWQFKPRFLPVLRESVLMGNAIKFLLFIYVSVICFAAAGIIGYTRSQSVGIANAQIFQDIKKLGADKNYCRGLMKKQVAKVYVLPTVMGVALAVFYETSILYGNDGHFLPDEFKVFFICVLLGGLAALFQFFMYGKSLKQVAKMLDLE